MLEFFRLRCMLMEVWALFGRVILFLFLVFSMNGQAFDEGFHKKVQSWQNSSLTSVSVYGERFGGFVAPALAIFPYALFSLHFPREENKAEYSQKISVWRDSARALFASTLLVWSGKTIIGRARPYLQEGAWSFEPFAFNDSGRNAFPSGHTSSAFAIAHVLSSHAKHWGVSVFLYGSASLTAFSRVYDSKHWLSDVLVGGALGYLAAEWSLTRGRDSLSAFEFYVLPDRVAMQWNF